MHVCSKKKEIHSTQYIYCVHAKEKQINKNKFIKFSFLHHQFKQK